MSHLSLNFLIAPLPTHKVDMLPALKTTIFIDDYDTF